MFNSLSLAPPDPILGLTDAFAKDPNPNKINLGVGVYQDATGKTPILACVKAAEQRLLASESSKDYLGIAGSPLYQTQVARLLFGGEHEIVQSGRCATAQTPGGTGALRVAADFLKATAPGATVWISDPTWPNHPNIFRAAGLQTKTYPYFNPSGNDLAFDAMRAALEQAPAGDVVLLHGCCHNPTGVDLSPSQWGAIADVIRRRQLLPLLDFAYQGFAEGLREDAVGLATLATGDTELLVCSSFSKNFGLYNERVGALTVVAGSSSAAQAAFSHIKQTIRVNYSNPPCHGAAIVATVLADDALRQQWEAELAAMRQRINGMRGEFVAALKQRMPARDFSFIARQRGMFSFSGITPDEVKQLRDKHAVYIVGSGRINVAGITPGNISRLCDAIADVLAG